MRFYPIAANIDESRYEYETADVYVDRMARTKARHIWARRDDFADAMGFAAGLPVLGADTTVVLDGRIYGKPQDKSEAIETLVALSGRRHQVLTAAAVCGAAGEDAVTVRTDVHFKTMTRAECEAYWASGEPRGKAGAYAIQGRGAVLVDRIEGSYSGVVGLPLTEVVQLLDKYHISYWHEAGP